MSVIVDSGPGVCIGGSLSVIAGVSVFFFCFLDFLL